MSTNVIFVEKFVCFSFLTAGNVTGNVNFDLTRRMVPKLTTVLCVIADMDRNGPQ